MDCHLRALDLRDSWVVYVWGETIPEEAIRGWLDEHGDFQPRDPGSRGRVLTVETEQLPDAWRGLLARSAVESVSLDKDGTAVVVMRGSRSEVQETIASLDQAHELEQLVTDTESPGPEGDRLTRAEQEALVRAFHDGYFDVPREIRLADLADRMDRSDGALSQLLRRGLRRLVASYVAGLPEEPPLHAPGQRESGRKKSSE